MDHTQAYFHWFTKTHAHVHLCRCQQACIEQSEKHMLTVCPCEDEGRTKQRKDGGSNVALPDSKSCSNGWRRAAPTAGEGGLRLEGFVPSLPTAVLRAGQAVCYAREHALTRRVRISRGAATKTR